MLCAVNHLRFFFLLFACTEWRAFLLYRISDSREATTPCHRKGTVYSGTHSETANCCCCAVVVVAALVWFIADSFKKWSSLYYTVSGPVVGQARWNGRTEPRRQALSISGQTLTVTTRGV